MKFVSCARVWGFWRRLSIKIRCWDYFWKVGKDLEDLGMLGSLQFSALLSLRWIDLQGVATILGRRKEIRAGVRFFLQGGGVRENTLRVSTTGHADWRADLAAARDLSELDPASLRYAVAGRLIGWRVRKQLGVGRAAAVAFWQEQVVVKPRQDWQLERWAEAIRWCSWVKTTEIYTHVAVGVNGRGVSSPLDRLEA